jgi:hypothetical protein
MDSLFQSLTIMITRISHIFHPKDDNIPLLLLKGSQNMELPESVPLLRKTIVFGRTDHIFLDTNALLKASTEKVLPRRISLLCRSTITFRRPGQISLDTTAFLETSTEKTLSGWAALLCRTAIIFRGTN